MGRQKPAILLLEDELQWIEVLSEYLSDDYEVCAARSITEAKLWLERRDIELALVDIRIISDDWIDESGFQFIEELRTREPLRDMSLIIISAYGTVERARKAFRDYKVDDFIDKGTLDPRELRATIAQLVAEDH